MNLYECKQYQDDIKFVANLELPWNKLENSSIMISGATGMIGSFLVDILMYRNKQYALNCDIYALGRNKERGRKRFGLYTNEQLFHFIECDINQGIECNNMGTIGYVIHLASNTHPVAYSTDPIGTITTNIIGTKNLFDFAAEHDVIRCAFASSNEIYGENRGDVELFDEEYCGYIDCNTLRAGYTESKRCGEALCQAYIKQKNMDIVISRITRCYGPTLLDSDTKALSQFLHKGIAGEDIVLKSDGMQYFSYIYVADAVSGLLTVLFKGDSGEAYNIADRESDIRLRDLAAIIAEYTNRNVIFELPDDVESAGYSKATIARLSPYKLQKLGWNAKYCIEAGIKRTSDILLCIINQKEF